MSLPIISAQTANGLNARVQEQIDARLFLFCNYEPTLLPFFGEDAKFVIAIQDLYKFSTDVGCILKRYSRFVNKGQFYSLGQLLSTIQMLRSVVDHNQSPNNGHFEQTYLDRYYEWVAAAIGKTMPSTMDDYARLNGLLNQMATELIQKTEQFIAQVNAAAHKDELIQKWIDTTLEWYCTKRDLYLGQLAIAYMANAATKGHSAGNGFNNAGELRRKVSAWIRTASFYRLEQEVTLLTQAERDPKSSFTEHQLRKIRERKADLKQQIAQRKARTNTESVSDFFENLKAQLLETMANLECEGVSYTLLPQHLIQEDIHRYFGGVPSPENDF